MTKKITKLICLCLALVTSVGILCACNNNDDYNSIEYYNAIMLDRANVLMKTDFLASLPSAEYGEFGEDTVLVVKNEEQFNEIFIGFPLSLNFKNEMLIVCVFTDINYGFPYKIKDICVDNEILRVSIYSDSPDSPNSSAPTQRALVVKMNKTNYSELKIIWS